MARRKRELGGEGTDSNGTAYTWRVEGFGNLRGGRWYGDQDTVRQPSDATIKTHIADPNWGMVVRVSYPDGSTRYVTLVGGYRPDAIGDVIDLMLEDYG